MVDKRQRKLHNVNGYAFPTEKLAHDSLDKLAGSMRRMVDRGKFVPGLLKADVDSAYRRVPLMPSHRWACGVAYKLQGAVMCAIHHACPFGAIASVHAWQRIGAALCFLSRKLLKLSMHRYVDDYFATDRPVTLEHGLQCFARLIRVLFGADAVADGKLDCGDSLCILGVMISMSEHGFRCRPDDMKIAKWVSALRRALADNVLQPGDASKLAGKLSWGGSQLFRRFGRAMLRPIFDRQTRRDGKVDDELRRSLQWWVSVLELELCELRRWKEVELPAMHLFCDASGNPAHLGAVLFVDGDVIWTHMEPAPHVLPAFRHRKNNQIMGLELLAISLGLCTFEFWLRGKRVVIHSDNTGSEVRHRLMHFSVCGWCT